MRLYSDTIASFLDHAYRMVREILSKECGINVGRTRFTIGRTTWPINLVCFEDNRRWGYFEPHFFQIGINARLVGTIHDSVLRDLLRHELAHYLVRVFHGPHVSAHGSEFKALCARYDWSEEVAAAAGDLPSIEKSGDSKSQAVIEKVKKLLALASSTNEHEAELATIKANQLILRYHLDRAELKTERELCVVTVMEATKKNTLMVAIYEILTHFLVRPMLYYGQGQVRLEAVGSREQTELALYIADFLKIELETLWKTNSKQHGLKGLRAKNSFFMGVAKGFAEKLHDTRKNHTEAESRALIKIETEALSLMREFMGEMSQSFSGQVIDNQAMESGRREGRNLSITPAVKSSGQTFLLK